MNANGLHPSPSSLQGSKCQILAVGRGKRKKQEARLSGDQTFALTGSPVRGEGHTAVGKEANQGKQTGQLVPKDGRIQQLLRAAGIEQPLASMCNAAAAAAQIFCIKHVQGLLNKNTDVTIEVSKGPAVALAVAQRSIGRAS